ncbi:hypothetical protein Gpo141_00008563 [Globisporangium polare]
MGSGSHAGGKMKVPAGSKAKKTAAAGSGSKLRGRPRAAPPSLMTMCSFKRVYQRRHPSVIFPGQLGTAFPAVQSRSST